MNIQESRVCVDCFDLVVGVDVDLVTQLLRECEGLLILVLGLVGGFSGSRFDIRVDLGLKEVYNGCESLRTRSRLAGK